MDEKINDNYDIDDNIIISSRMNSLEISQDKIQDQIINKSSDAHIIKKGKVKI